MGLSRNGAQERTGRPSTKTLILLAFLIRPATRCVPVLCPAGKLRKHLLVAGIDRRRHFKPLGQGADPVGTLMSHQQRDRRLVHEIVGHPAEQPLTQAKMPVSARDDEVSLLSLPAISRAPTSLRRLLTR